MTKAKVESRKAKVGWPLSLAMTFAVIALAGCDYFGFTPIKDIVAAPGQFEGKEVKIKGRAVDPVQLLSLRSFTLKDDTIMLSVELMAPAEREAWLKRLRAGNP